MSPDLKYNREYEKLVPRPTSEEFEALRESMERHGQFYPIIVNENLEILDGHTRNKICLYIKLTPKYKIMRFENKLLEKKFVIESNLKRRHLNNYQKIELGIPLLEIEKQLAKQRKLSKLKHSRTSSAPDDANEGKSAEIVAKKIGVSTSTFERGQAVYKKAPEHIKQKLRKGSLSVNTAFNLVTRKERNLPKARMPEGKFDVILCDVPIAFNDQGGRGAAANHYDTMSPYDLMQLQVPTPKNAIIFFWMSPSIAYDTIEIEISAADDDGHIVAVRLKVPVYKAILDTWGFETVKNEFAWDKEIIGRGNWNRNQHENCFIAIKGNMPTPAELFPSIIRERRTQHSKKPESIYGIIERMYPKRKYLELFARQKHSGKWAVFGNQLEAVAA